MTAPAAILGRTLNDAKYWRDRLGLSKDTLLFSPFAVRRLDGRSMDRLYVTPEVGPDALVPGMAAFKAFWTLRTTLRKSRDGMKAILFIEDHSR